MRGISAALRFPLPELDCSELKRADGGWIGRVQGKPHWVPDHYFERVELEPGSLRVLELVEEVTSPEYKCPDCGKMCTDLRGLGVHRKKAHGR